MEATFSPKIVFDLPNISCRVVEVIWMKMDYKDINMYRCRKTKQCKVKMLDLTTSIGFVIFKIYCYKFFVFNVI